MSKHDLMTFAISVVLVLSLVALVITNHFTGTIETIFTGLIPGVFGYWFGRGTAQGGSDNASNVPGNPGN